MTFHLVHLGKGKAIQIDDAPIADLTFDAPRKAQVLRNIAKHLSRRRVSEQVAAYDKAHTNYQPGTLEHLGNDQCRFSGPHDTMMCGAKTVKGRRSKSYCEHHYYVVFKRGPFS